MLDRERFWHHVQDAFAHLYDYAFLQTHPLAALVSGDGSRTTLGRALHDALMGAIESLKPPPGTPPRSNAWRAYRCLCLRYQELLPMPDVADELGISERQCRRDHHEAMEAVVSMLWERYGARVAPIATDASTPASASPPAPTPLQVEASRLAHGRDGDYADLGSSVRSALATMAALADARAVRVVSSVPPDPVAVRIGATPLRQVLLAVLHGAIDWASDPATAGAVARGLDARGDDASGGSRGAPAQRSREVLVERARADPRGVALRVEAERQSSAPASDTDWLADRLEVAHQLLEPWGGSLSHAIGGRRLVVTLALLARRALSVLVVDDNPDALRLYERYLEEGAYRLAKAKSAKQALQLAQDFKPDVIALDVMMPGQDGWEVLQTLRSHPATGHIPVLICSVLPERELALALGAADFLPKPLTRQELADALERCAASAPANPRRP